MLQVRADLIIFQIISQIKKLEKKIIQTDLIVCDYTSFFELFFWIIFLFKS